jgi:hypothetical protein
MLKFVCRDSRKFGSIALMSPSAPIAPAAPLDGADRLKFS